MLSTTDDLVTGLMVCAKSGFYYVLSGGEVYTCRARGVFRNQNITPLVGDRAEILRDDDGLCYVVNILERKNCLQRPPVANLDRLFIISSVVRPTANTLMNDKLCAVAEYKKIEPVVIYTKCDLADPAPLVEHYRGSGIACYTVSSVTGEGVDEVRGLTDGVVSSFTGNTGAGKSTLLNALFPGLSLATAEISDKLGRGRHTTRTVELFKTDGGYVADTPGFSSPELAGSSEILRSELASCFPEFRPYLLDCRFASDCAHVKDLGCAVRAAVDKGLIGRGRYENYVQMYSEAPETLPGMDLNHTAKH